jgi:hypothetical protein
MRLLAIAALAFLAACGGSGGDGVKTGPDGLVIGPPPSGQVYVQAVATGTLGLYDEVSGDGRVSIREDTLQNNILATRILVHELGHALGLSHSPGSGCVMDSEAMETPNASLCPAESAFAQGYAGPVLIVYAGINPPSLWQLTANAASIWNQAAGRTIVAVQ